ncbi:ADP-ribosyltransferase-containing protein [Latilactobacillus fragifolii]|uniref:ADP-ribosyltransferase-containing protein n=1 Tax=Latilactobacillus fragifolii TaxID=2814244 RepID=UPI001ABB3F40|nr:hypothetical protein [Latilactobacillus fragifolii]
MTKTTLYHGSTQKFSEFDLKHLGQNGTAQGAGIYTTPDQDVAAMYAQLTDEPGYIYQVASDLKKPLSLDRMTVSDQELSKIIDQLHEETDLLSNYGDVEYSGYSLVKDEALELLRENDNDVDLFNDLASATGDPEITAETFESVGDYTHIISHDQTRLNSDVYTILNPKNVEITNIESTNYEKEIPEEINNWLQQDLVPTHGKGNDKFYISQEEGKLIISDVLSMDGDVSYDLNRKGIELAEIEQEISRHFKNYKSIDKFYDDAEISTKNMTTEREANKFTTIDARATIYNGDFHQEVETLVQKNYQNTTTKTNELEPGIYHETLQFDADGRQRQLTMLYGEQNKVELGMDQLSENGTTTLKIGGDQQGGQIIRDLLDSPQLADKEVTFTPNDAVHSEMDYHSPNRTKRSVDQSIGIE